MIKSFASELLAAGLLSEQESVVVGVSGGPDSMALLHLLVGLNTKMGWELQLHLAHLNHRLRGEEAEKDAAFVQALADSLDLPCTIDIRDVADLASEYGESVEAMGRRERYAFFERVCLRTDSRVVAVGHHSDDNAETVLHRILRGTGLRGMSGIPICRPISRNSEIRIIRPLLRRSRKWILSFLAESGIAYREDETNKSNEPMRNRIRNNILPIVETEVNPQVCDALNRLAEQAGWLDEFLSETVQRTFETLVISHTDQELVLNVDALARKSRIVQSELVRTAYTTFGLGEQDLSFVHMTAALDLISHPGSGKRIQLPEGMTISKEYRRLVFSLPTEQPREAIAEEIAVHLPGETKLPMRRLLIGCSIQDVREEDIPALRRRGSAFEEFVDFDAVKSPLVIRARRSGERFFPLGAPGSKKLSDFLIDAKVGPKQRERVAVLCDHLGPIWVVGHRIDERVKLTALTRRVLHLWAKPLES